MQLFHFWLRDVHLVQNLLLCIDPLLDMRTTKWQQQLWMTMQCRSYSWRRTSECLFVTACSMDQYAEEKNLIVRYAVVYLKPKQLIIKDCTRHFALKLWRTWSIAQPLCDSRASCSLRYGDITIFKMAAVRYLEFWKFSFLIIVTFIQFKICCCVQNFVEIGWFFRCDITI